MSKQLKLVPMSGQLHDDDRKAVARLVACLHTGRDPVTGLPVADLISNAVSEGTITAPRDDVKAGPYPYSPDDKPTKGPNMRYMRHRCIAIRTDKSACIVGPFRTPKNGVGFATVLDPIKKIIGITADSNAGNNDGNTTAHFAALTAPPEPKAEPKKRGRKAKQSTENMPDTSGDTIDDGSDNSSGEVQQSDNDPAEHSTDKA